jgi:L-amino acid N-acyltransferase YncA
MRSSRQTYPCNVALEGAQILLERMAPRHEAAVLGLTQSLPPHDLLFLRRDISQPKVVAAWAQAIADGRIESLLAWRDDELVGCSAIVREPHAWAPHVAELRIVVAAAVRGQGLGRLLIQRSCALASDLGFSKLTMLTTPDQRAALSVFDSLGFRPEALLRNQVKDAEGRKHDLVLLARAVRDEARISA